MMLSGFLKSLLMDFLLSEAHFHIIVRYLLHFFGFLHQFFSLYRQLDLFHLLVQVGRGRELVSRRLPKLAVLVLTDRYELRGEAPLQLRLHLPCVDAEAHHWAVTVLLLVSVRDQVLVVLNWTLLKLGQHRARSVWKHWRILCIVNRVRRDDFIPQVEQT